MRSVLYIFLLSFTLLSSCTMFSLLPSGTRPPQLYEIQLEKDLFISSTGSVTINKKEFLPASTCIRFQDYRIFIDPVAITHTDSADLILLTHPHGDHFSIEDIDKLIKPSTIILAPNQLASDLRKKGYNADPIQPNNIRKFQKVTIETLPAYNTDNVLLFLKAHPRNSGYLSYLLNFNNGTKIFYTGDSHYIPEFKSLGGIDIILIPLGDGTLTMNSDDAIKMINDLMPSKVIPLHYLLNSEDLISDFQDSIPDSTRLLLLE